MAIIAHWKENTFSSFTKLNAQNCYDELVTLGNTLNISQYQEVPNQDVVDYARNNTNSELHNAFEWNDFEAAEAFRRHTAKNLKNALYTYKLESPQVEMDDQEGEPLEIPLFINPGHKNVKGHVTTQFVMSDSTLRQATLDKALAELKSFEKRYAFLTELATVFQAINSLNIP